MDDLIASSGVAYRALTNPSFMDNIVRQAEAIKTQGMFFSPIAGERKLPAVATRDTAAPASASASGSRRRTTPQAEASAPNPQLRPVGNN